MAKLPEIVKLFQAEGKNQLPVAIIQDGTTTREKVGIGTVNTIEQVVYENELSNPAIIVFGEVVSHRAQLAKVKSELITKELASWIKKKKTSYILFS